jgi:hypothetical protein
LVPTGALADSVFWLPEVTGVTDEVSSPPAELAAADEGYAETGVTDDVSSPPAELAAAEERRVNVDSPAGPLEETVGFEPGVINGVEVVSCPAADEAPMGETLGLAEPLQETVGLLPGVTPEAEVGSWPAGVLVVSTPRAEVCWAADEVLTWWAAADVTLADQEEWIAELTEDAASTGQTVVVIAMVSVTIASLVLAEARAGQSVIEDAQLVTVYTEVA